MAIDFGGVAVGDNYSSAFVPKLNEVMKASAFMFDPGLISYTGTIPTGAKRLNSGNLETYNGTSWVSQPINGLQASGALYGVGGTPAYQWDVQGSGNVIISAKSSAASGVAAALRVANGTRAYQIGVAPGVGNSEFTLYDETGGAVRLRMEAGGNFGIGGSVAPIAGGPLMLFQKSGTFNSENTATLYLRTGSGAGTVGLTMGTDATANAAWIQSIEPTVSYSSKQLRLNPNGGPVWTGSSFGIGINPAAALHVQLANETGNASNSGAVFQSPSGTRQLMLGTDTTNGRTWVQSWVPGTGAGKLALNPNGGDVYTAGFFGIGNASPAVAFDIDASAGEIARWNSTNVNGGFLRWRQAGTDVGYFGTGPNLGATTSEFIVLAGSGKNLLLAANNDPSAGNRVQIDTNGRLIVGASSGASIGSGIDKLAVAGGIGTSGIQFNTNAAANYEFVHRTAGMGWYFYTNGAAQVPFKILSGAATDTLVVNSTGVMYGGIEVGYRDVPLNVQAGTYSVVAADRGKVVVASGNVTVNTGLTAGAAILVYNNTAGTIQLIQGTSLTLRKAGTTTTGTVTIAARGFANVLSLNAGEYVVSGNVT